MSLFNPRSLIDIARLVRDYPLANLVSLGPSGFFATPLPLIADPDGEGAIEALIGHFALRNPQVAALRQDKRALAIFNGPQGYVSPRLVSRPGWGPTWNYAVVRCQLEVTFTPERNDEALARLAEALEGDGEGAWHPRRMGQRYESLSRHIIAFRARVLSTEASFKLGQDEDDATFAEIVQGIEPPELARMMKAQRPE